MCNLSTRTSVTYVPGLYIPQGEGVPLLESGVMQRSPRGEGAMCGRGSNMRDCSRICAKPTTHANTGGFHEGEGASNAAAWVLVSRVVADSRPRHVNLGAVAIAMNGVRQEGNSLRSRDVSVGAAKLPTGFRSAAALLPGGVWEFHSFRRVLCCTRQQHWRNGKRRPDRGLPHR